MTNNITKNNEIITNSAVKIELFSSTNISNTLTKVINKRANKYFITVVNKVHYIKFFIIE